MFRFALSRPDSPGRYPLLISLQVLAAADAEADPLGGLASVSTTRPLFSSTSLHPPRQLVARGLHSTCQRSVLSTSASLTARTTLDAHNAVAVDQQDVTLSAHSTATAAVM